MSGRWRHRKRAKLATDGRQDVFLQAFRAWSRKGIYPSPRRGETLEFVSLFGRERYGVIALDKAIRIVTVEQRPQKETRMRTHRGGSGRWGSRPGHGFEVWP
jgi:hypothetical protein